MKRQAPKTSTGANGRPPTSTSNKTKDASASKPDAANAKRNLQLQSEVTFKTPESRATTRAPAKKPSSSPLGKSYMSKSHDNLASVLRRKAASSNQRPRSVIGLPDSQDPDSDTASAPGGSPPQAVKRHSVTQIASRTTLGIKTGAIKKASSTQNISKQSTAVKRAASTQNVSREKNGRQRISAPANIMAYNAELLASFEKERKIHEEKISELRQCAETRKSDLEKCRFEIKRLKEMINEGDQAEEMEALKHENKLLKDKLIEAGVSVEHITDTEKLSRLERERLECRQDSMSGTSDSTCRSKQPNVGSSRGGEIDGFDTRSIDSDFAVSEPDISYPMPGNTQLIHEPWQRPKLPEDALSEISVACLQDRILQMEETHYSTHEELQATLQELCDLQNTVNDLSAENERLADEKGVLLESLCAQTEKLEHCRIQIEHLKSLLLNENHTQKSERERQLLEIIKAAQVERDEMLLRQHELSYSLHNSELLNRENQEIIMSMKDDMRLLEDKAECILRDKRSVDEQCRELRETLNSEYIEVQKMKSLLETEKTKVVELEQCRDAQGKTELESLLGNALEEKKKYEDKCTDIQETLSMSRCDVLKLNERIGGLEDELNCAKNNAQLNVGDMEYKFRQLVAERDELKIQTANLREHIDQLEQDCDRYLEEKKAFTNQIDDLKKKIDDQDSLIVNLRREIQDLARKHEEEYADWRQFQSDLQKAVVIANDIKMEAQQDFELVQNENHLLKDKIINSQQEISRIKSDLENLKDEKEDKESGRLDLRGRVMSSVDREFSIRQQNRKTNNSQSQQLSVKNLIKSIENHQVAYSLTSPPGSVERKRSDSLTSPHSPAYLDLSPCTSPCLTSPNIKDKARRSSMPADSHLKPALKKCDENPLPTLNQTTTFPVTELTLSPPTPTPSNTDPGVGVTTTGPTGANNDLLTTTPAPLSSLLSTTPISSRRNSMNEQCGKDPLASLVKTSGGSKRNALLKWCQSKTINYKEIDITNFSSSWNDGLAFCALLHSYLPHKIPYNDLGQQDKRRNFTLAFKAAESVGIATTLSTNDMVAMERPDWQAVMAYVTSVYKHFELCGPMK